MDPSPTDVNPLPNFDALWNYGDPAATEAKFQEVLSQVRDNAPHAYLAELYSQIGRTYGLRRRFEESREWVDRAEAECRAGEAAGEDLRRARVRCLLERGRSYNSGGEPATSVPMFAEALALAESAGEENLAVDAAHMLGIAVPGDGGLDWNLKAIAMAEAAEDPLAQKWLGSLYNNTGWSLHDLARFEEALDLFRRSLAFRLDQGKVAEIRIAKWCVARCLRSLGRLDEALAMQEALAEEFAADDSPDGYVHEELGELLLALGRGAEAKPEFARAYALLSQDTWLPHNEPDRLARMKELGGA